MSLTFQQQLLLTLVRARTGPGPLSDADLALCVAESHQLAQLNHQACQEQPNSGQVGMSRASWDELHANRLRRAREAIQRQQEHALLSETSPEGQAPSRARPRP